MTTIYVKRLLVVLILFLLPSCTQQKITSGVVYDKTHTPMQMTTYWVPNDNRFEPRQFLQPDIWTISFKKTISGREYSNAVNVTRSVYDNLKIGDQFSIDQLLEQK